MAFCEECGAKLSPGARFCEECGTPVPDEANSSAQVSPPDKNWYNSFAVFKSVNWETEWRAVASEGCGEELGIILTCEASLVAQLALDADALHDILGEYMRQADKRGVHYYYLDLENNAIQGGLSGENVAEIVALLRKVVDVARPKYIFILGNEEIIDVATWENQSSDGDDEVFSDLVYSTLDTISPWEGQEFNASEALRVGRLPTTNGCADDFRAYFENAIHGIGCIDSIHPYGLSALVWEAESNEEYSAVSDSNVSTCPKVILEDMDEELAEADANLLFFNLHGSDDTEYWYGQKGGSYPEAVSPDVFRDYPGFFFLGVEACYGARYIGLEPGESIVKTALANKCLAFLGSSKIAYGTSEPEGTCADIVIGDFIRQIAKGETAGDAHLAGLKRLTSNSDMDDSDIKTLAEFSLYGDPSACTGKNRNVGAMKGMMKKLGGVPKGIHIPMPDVRRATKLYLTEIDAKLESAIDDFVASKLMPDILQKGLAVEQKTFSIPNKKLFQKLYSVDADPVRQIARVYFDGTGKIHKALLSK
ncbi:MAG: zinc ribbon domain-containing protein [Lentisphaeria bacterium]|nr:zinc ribbon domain-containing protein [Lentisphaeria bacterium]